MEMLQLDEQQLEQTHKIQVMLLDQVDRICRKHDIKYMICDGTLLGAIRHKGFIPWDDDIDISMERPEYEKFCKVCQQELDGDKFFFQTYNTDENYPWIYAKMRYNYSKFVRAGQEHLDMNDGIFLDIFPLDGVPNNRIVRYFFNIKRVLFRKMLYSVVGSVSEKNPFKRTVFKILNKFPKRSVHKGFEAMAQKYNDPKYKYITNYAFPEPLRERRWIHNMTDVEFEGKLYQTTAHYDEWLTVMYGDYMELPPVEERHGNCNIVIFSVNDENVQKK